MKKVILYIILYNLMLMVKNFNCSCVQTAMMSQTSCQLTLLSGGEASSWSTFYVRLYR